MWSSLVVFYSVSRQPIYRVITSYHVEKLNVHCVLFIINPGQQMTIKKTAHWITTRKDSIKQKVNFQCDSAVHIWHIWHCIENSHVVFVYSSGCLPPHCQITLKCTKEVCVFSSFWGGLFHWYDLHAESHESWWLWNIRWLVSTGWATPCVAWISAAPFTITEDFLTQQSFSNCCFPSTGLPIYLAVLRNLFLTSWRKLQFKVHAVPT